MIAGMLSGKLATRPESKAGQSGRQFVKCRIQVHDGEAHHTAFVVAFADTACRTLLALDAGAAVCISGPVKLSVWRPDQGEPRVNMSVVADEVISPGTLKRRREAAAGPGGSPPEPPAPPSRDQQRVDQANRETRAQWKDDPSGFDSMESDTPF